MQYRLDSRVPDLSNDSSLPLARPALSAARGIEIIDLMAAQPGRAMTMSEIARAAGINVASCHAVLTVLVERGYLRREGKSYRLGPALFAAGQAALAGDALLGHAEAAARRLFADLALPVTITALVGNEIVGVLSLGGGDRTLLRVGARREPIPPTGAAFVAWNGEDAIARWAAQSPDRSPAAVGLLRRGAQAIRERGFEVLLNAQDNNRLASRLQSFSATGSLRMGPGMVLLETVQEARAYDVLMIAAPVFDQGGACAFNLCLGPFPEPIPGARVLELADRLLADCVAVMQADRSQ